jgi:dynein assembly factor 5
MNILAESTSDRSAKRRALEKIGKELKLEEDLQVSLETFKLLIRPLLRCLSDSVEKCRELGSVIIQG